MKTPTCGANGRPRMRPFAMSLSVVMIFAALSSLASAADRMTAGSALAPNQSLQSTDGSYQLLYQPDGNLVIYRVRTGEAIWNSGTPGTAGQAVLQTDGNFVLYNAANQAVWQTTTAGNEDATLVLQADGNLVLYRADSLPIWSWASGLIAQPPPAPTVVLTGTVTSTTGDAIAGATIRVLDGVNAGRSTTTGSTGTYRLSGLTAGNGNVAASATGYSESRTGLYIDGTRALTFRLTQTGPRTTFSNGTFRIGTDIRAGRYYTTPSRSGCYWERVSGFGGTIGEIIANNFVGFLGGQEIVDISSSDLGFTSDSDCGTWTQTPRTAPSAGRITPGRWLVGSQISSGTYRAAASSGCYWERLRDFGGRLSAIITNDFVAGGGFILVTISSSDVGFYADDDCGTWTRTDSAFSSAISPLSVFSIERNRRMQDADEGDKAEPAAFIRAKD